MDIVILTTSLLVFFGYSFVYFLLMKILKERQMRDITPLLYVIAVGVLLYISDYRLIAVPILSLVLLTLFIATYTISIFSFVYNRPLKMSLISVLSARNGKSLEEIKELLNSKIILDEALKHLQATKQITIQGQAYIVRKKHKAFLIGSVTDGLESLLNISQK